MYEIENLRENFEFWEGYLKLAQDEDELYDVDRIEEFQHEFLLIEMKICAYEKKLSNRSKIFYMLCKYSIDRKIKELENLKQKVHIIQSMLKFAEQIRTERRKAFC